MKITVKDCLALDAMRKSVLLAGEKKINNSIRSVSVLDAVDRKSAACIAGLKDQLLLTSFAGVGSESERAAITGEVASKGAAGLVVFGAEKDDSRLKDVKTQAAKSEFPLIIMDSSSETEYSDVITQVMDKLLYEDNFRNGLISNTIYHLLDFDKQPGFEAALREAALSNEFQVVLLSTDFNPILTIETRQRITVADAIRFGKEKNVEGGGVYTFIDVNGVLTYWGPIVLGGEKYFLLIVDNEDNYSAGEITKLAEIIEIAMGMWKYSPERDVKAEFIKALIRANKSLAYSIKDEMELSGDDIISVFYAKGIETSEGNTIIADFEKKEKIEVMSIAEGEETYGVILLSGKKADEEESSQKSGILRLYDKLKEGNKGVRIFHATGIDGIEGAGDAFRLINETWTFVESVFPYKRVFTKYELALVSNCINLQVQGGYLKKNYMDLLEPFNREMGENKAKQLLETLETFVLDAGMNSGKTSQFMGIHTNTVQYRLKKINEVLGAEITGNRVIPGLTMALALKRLEKVVR